MAAINVVMAKENLYNQPMVCNQCKNAFCEKACPTNAFVRDEITGALKIDANLCVGCGACVDACPYGFIKISPKENKVYKCDLCGGNPQCVNYCPTGALEVIAV